MKTLLVLALAFGVQAQTVEISWDKNTDNTDGYNVYFSADSLNLKMISDVGEGITDPNDQTRIKQELFKDDTSWTWNPDKRYFAAVKAYSASGNESDFSSIVGFEVKDKTKPATADNIRIVVIDADGNVSIFVKQE